MRFALVLTALLVATTAGCFSNGPDTPSDPGDDEPEADSGTWLSDGSGNARAAASPLSEMAAQWISIGARDGREPTIQIDSTGAVFYAARDYTGGGGPLTQTETPVMRSLDGGANWTEVSPMLPTGDRNPPISNDPMIFIDPWTDRLFQIEQVDVACHWMVWSDDQGATWGTNPRACTSPPADHQTIAAGPSALGLPLPVYPNVVYVCVNQIAASSCSKSLDGGQTLGTYHVVFPGVGVDCPDGSPGSVQGGLHGHVLVGPDGTVYLPRGYCGLPFVGISRDDGLTWSRVAVSDTPHRGADPNMAFDASGRVYYTWLADDGRLRLSWSTDSGATWSAPVIASPPELHATNLPAIAAGDDGRIALAYMGLEQELPDDDADTNLTWNGYLTVSLDAASADPTFATVRANPDGNVLKRGYCTAGRCGLVRDFLDVAIAPDGSAWGAFIDACLGPAEPRVRGEGDCNVDSAEYGEGNGNLAYAARTSGVTLRS
ncbi:MAG: sialidase family protein [Candidatus Thermoplasmatota archaeon]